MKLVGATNWFVRVPLIVEGVIFGAAGALAAWLLLKLGGVYVSQTVERLPFMAQFHSDVDPSLLALALIVLGIGIGAAGSFMSIRRFLSD